MVFIKASTQFEDEFEKHDPPSPKRSSPKVFYKIEQQYLLHILPEI